MASPLQTDRRVSRFAQDVLGSGLALPLYVALVAVSVALFAFWDGPLWTQPAEASHVGRFAVSYLAVIPLAVVLLGLVRKLSWRHLLTTLGTVWAIKLLITSAMYTALAGGTATVLEPATAPVPSAVDAAPGPRAYEAATTAFESGSITGAATLPSDGAWAVVAYVVQPGTGAPRPEPREIQMTIANGAYDQPIYLATIDDDLTVVNSDPRLYTAHLYGDDGSPANQTVPPNGHASLPDLEPGLYRIRSDSATAETWLLVVDHPYAAVATDGAFELANVPAGAREVTVIAVRGDRALRATAEATVTPTAPATLDVAF